MLLDLVGCVVKTLGEITERCSKLLLLSFGEVAVIAVAVISVEPLIDPAAREPKIILGYIAPFNV